MTGQSQTLHHDLYTLDPRRTIPNPQPQTPRHSCVAHCLELGRSTSTISRELRRNISARGYLPALAQDQATARQKQRRNARQFDAAQWQLVELYLRLSLSPQQVSDRLALEDRLSISTEAIYQYAYANKAQGGDLVGYLRCQKLRESAMPVGSNAVGCSRTGSA